MDNITPEQVHAAKQKLIFALDGLGGEAAITWVQMLMPFVGTFKVGLELFTREGPPLIRAIRSLGANVFLDLKLHDIPNTVQSAVRVAVSYDVSLLTVHASGGAKMLQAAVGATKGTNTQILAVTALTSLDANDLYNMGLDLAIPDFVTMLAGLAQDHGVPGVVCSGQEVSTIREQWCNSLRVVPGVRPTGAATQDQTRVVTPTEAIKRGATHIVVGRPILEAYDPINATTLILEEVIGAQDETQAQRKP